MSEKLTDPRPAATEAAMSDKEAIWVEVNGRVYDAQLIAHDESYTIWPVYKIRTHVPAAAPPSGQVCVDEAQLTTLISELIYQQGKLNQSESIGKATGIVRRLVGNGAAR